MGLDHVMILNMEHDIERYWASMGALDTLKFYIPSGQVIRHINYNGMNYKDTKSVHEAAIADGFPSFGSYRSTNRARAAWVWSYQSALRKIVEMDKTVLLLIDDYVPEYLWPRDRFDALIEEVQDKGLRIIQLAHSDLKEEVYLYKDLVTASLAKGLAGANDFGVVINGAGAALVLKVYEANPNLQPNEIYSVIKELGEHDPQMCWGMYHTVEIICRMLCDDIFESQVCAVPPEEFVK